MEPSRTSITMAVHHSAFSSSAWARTTCCAKIPHITVNGQANIFTVHRQALLFLRHGDTYTISTNLVGTFTGVPASSFLEDTLNAHREVAETVRPAVAVSPSTMLYLPITEPPTIPLVQALENASP